MSTVKDKNVKNKTINKRIKIEKKSQLPTTFQKNIPLSHSQGVVVSSLSDLMSHDQVRMHMVLFAWSFDVSINLFFVVKLCQGQKLLMLDWSTHHLLCICKHHQMNFCARNVLLALIDSRFPSDGFYFLLIFWLQALLDCFGSDKSTGESYWCLVLQKLCSCQSW